MAGGITIRMRGLDKVLNKMYEFPVRVQRGIDQEMGAAVDEMVTEAKANAPADEGMIRNSISAKHDKLKHKAFMQKSYGVYMEFGTKGQTKVPPFLGSYANKFKGRGTGSYKDALKSVEGWVKRKGVTGTYSVKTRRRTGNKDVQEQQNKRAAYLILRKILRDGLKPRPYFFPAYANAKLNVVKRIKQMLKEEVKR